jgi:hypothetical protein
MLPDDRRENGIAPHQGAASLGEFLGRHRPYSLSQTATGPDVHTAARHCIRRLIPAQETSSAGETPRR